MMLAKSLQSAAGNAAAEANYIESVFQTHLYTGNDSTQTITNGIDLAGEGGLVWLKCRNLGYSHILSDTNRGTGKFLSSDTTAAQGTDAQDVTAFNATGFTVGNNSRVNNSSFNYASWTFRKQEKFFDCVTYTGQTDTPQTIAHSLGSAPGMIIIKAVNDTGNWVVYHRSTGNQRYLLLNSTNAQSTVNTAVWNSTTPTATDFYVGAANLVNYTGVTYVAYLFAHDAGGFGLSGTDNVISCGSFTTDGSGNATVNLGYEPQWVMVKASSTTGGWYMFDTMREMSQTNSRWLLANTSAAEATGGGTPYLIPTATGFTANNSFFSASSTNIYIAIRRGPMKTPTTGTSVFDVDTYSGNGTAGRLITTNFPVDMVIGTRRSDVTTKALTTRLTGASLRTNDTIAEEAARSTFDSNIGNLLTASYPNTSGDSSVQWAWQRAPGFFDVVCWTGNGASTRSVNHNLTVAPELLIAQNRTSGGNWNAYLPSGNVRMALNFSSASPTYGGAFAGTTPTATTFSFDVDLNTSGQNYVSYLFASCPGVSKVGSYTGTGTTQQINCGFTAGARFVLIKRTDSTGDWYVWDSARGIVAGNDPYLLLNSTAAEVTSTDYIDTYSAGFEISSTAPAAINASGGSFIFFAVS